MLMLTIFVDFAQIIGQGPSLENAMPAVHGILAAFEVNLPELVDVEDGTFYIVLDCVLATLLLWFF